MRYDLRKRARDIVAGGPPGHDPDDDGALSFDDWPAEAEESEGKEWDGLGAMQGDNN